VGVTPKLTCVCVDCRQNLKTGLYLCKVLGMAHTLIICSVCETLTSKLAYVCVRLQVDLQGFFYDTGSLTLKLCCVHVRL